MEGGGEHEAVSMRAYYVDTYVRVPVFVPNGAVDIFAFCVILPK